MANIGDNQADQLELSIDNKAFSYDEETSSGNVIAHKDRVFVDNAKTHPS